MKQRHGQISKQQKEISSNNHFNIVDILLLDHCYLKECISTLKDNNRDNKTKLKYGRGFLDALKKHYAGEKKALYIPLKEAEKFRPIILESEIKQGIIEAKVRSLSLRLTRMRVLNETMKAELKVLAGLVEHHLDEEENQLFIKIKKAIKNSMLNEMGFQFMLARQFTKKDLIGFPDLKEESLHIRKVPRIQPKQFLARVHAYLT